MGKVWTLATQNVMHGQATWASHWNLLQRIEGLTTELLNQNLNSDN